jgi:hypothetical protein
MWPGGDKEAEQGEPEQLPVQRWAEVFVGGEGLARGPVEVLATLLHEARTPRRTARRRWWE